MTPGSASPGDKKLKEFPAGTIIGSGRFKLMELVQCHPTLGLTYNAINQQGEGFIVKMDSEENLLSFVRSEAGFLQAASKANASEHFVTVVHGARWQKMIYFVTKFRPGPSLNDCLCAMPQGKFNVGTAARCAYRIAKAVEVVHKLGYLLRRIDPNVIKFDATNRQIYLSDLSSTRVDPVKAKLNTPVKWAGASIYAPMQHHAGGSISPRHDLEPLIYFLVEMTTGHLPWEQIPPDMIASAKRQAITDQSLFRDCPTQYAALFTYISCLTDDNVDYKQIYGKFEESWKAAGVKDVNEPYEWEAIMKPVDAEPNQ